MRLFVSEGHPPVTATGALVAANTCTPILRPLCTCATGSTEVRESTERTEGGDDLHLLHCLDLALGFPRQHECVALAVRTVWTCKYAVSCGR